MSDLEKLPKIQPAEVYVEGTLCCSGLVSGIHDQGLLLSGVSYTNGKRGRKSGSVRPGSRGELVFLELFNDDGDRLVVPVDFVEVKGEGISVDFQDQVSELAGTVRRLLTRESADMNRSARAADAGAALRKRSRRQLERIMSQFIDETADHLFDLSSRPSSRDIQDDLYESMNILKRGRITVVTAFLKQIDGFFDDPVRPTDRGKQSDDDMSYHDLDLVDLKDFEDSLMIDRLVKKWQDKFALPIEALTIRFAEITGTGILETRLPVHIAQLCQAFRRSLQNREIPGTVAPELYSFFSDRVLAKLDPFYTSLNVFLRDQGIRPELDQELEKHGSLIKRMEQEKAAKQEPAAAPEPEEEPDLIQEARAFGLGGESVPPLQEGQATNLNQPGAAASAAAAPGGATGGAAGFETPTAAPGATTAAPGQPAAAPASRFNDPTQLYNSVIEALNFRRSVPSGSAVERAIARMTGEDVEQADTGKKAGSDRLALALSALQNNQSVRSRLKQKGSILEYLSANQDKIAGLSGTNGFEPECVNQLDLVDNLFSDISTEIDVTPDMRPVVGDLQIPLAKLALLEPQFFADRSHPARGVIDKTAQLASSSNFPNKPLGEKLTAIIQAIVENYESDSTVFGSALNDLNSLTNQQLKALERNIERVVKTQEGQEKLRKAELAVNRVLKNRIRPPEAPKPIVDLVNAGWRDLLKLTFVKQGPNSRAWKDYVKTLDLLSLWLLERHKGVEDEEVLLERALEAEPLIDMISQQMSEALPTNTDHVEVLEHLREVLAGRAELEYVDVDEQPGDKELAAEKVREKVETLPRLRRWVRRAEDLERGDWLTYRDEKGARRRIQLAWVSEDKDRYVFVNERGQKAADLSNVQLARRLSKGLKPPAPSEELPLVDQTMYKTLEHVQTSLSFDKNHDDLTRLINRDKFMDQINQALKHAKTKRSNHALLYVDIDKFGIVNDVYDETTGDQILVEFGKLLAQQHGKKISSARFGEDRFGVLLLDRTLEQSIAHAESIRSDIERSPVSIDGEKISFTVSIGVAPIRDHSGDVEEIIEHAASAAREAKEQGGNRVAQFNVDKARVDAYKAEETAAIKKIEQALDTKAFVLQAQPIARLRPEGDEMKVEHYEILMAISGDDGKLHSPMEFIGNAERFGYMTQVDQWVVREVFKWVSSLMDEQKVVPSLAINLSGNSVTDDAFMDYLFEQISEYGVGTNKICFEITETGTISNMVKATDFVNEFKNIGCRFSIDDFGTGLASHSYLRELPVDFVKIDGTFIQSIDSNPKDFAMTRSINDLAHFLGQETIAEFAENSAVIGKLREIGVDYVQGWGVGRPEPLSELGNKLAPLEK